MSVCQNYVCQHLSVKFSLQKEFSVWQFSVRTNVVSFTSASKPSFYFFSRCLNALSACKWEKSESQEVWVCFSVCLYPIELSNLQSLVVAVVKLKVKNLSFKVCEELSARKSCPKSKVCQNRKVCLCRIADSSSKTFQRINLCLSVFHYDT